MKKLYGVVKKAGVSACLSLLLASVAAQAPAASDEQRTGAHLIGAIEGPEVVTDPARMPTQFREAPPLAALVEQGKLPPVSARLPAEPLVIQTLARHRHLWWHLASRLHGSGRQVERLSLLCVRHPDVRRLSGRKARAQRGERLAGLRPGADVPPCFCAKA